jgi:hypothetical protein
MDVPQGIRGTWVSAVRETTWGPMRFEIGIGDDSRLDLTGTPLIGPEDEVYRRSGPYRLEEDRLITPAVNEGQPVHFRLRDGLLHLTIDDGLEFRLRRK